MSEQRKKQQCYIYTRVSTQMQADKYSLDAQRERLRREAERRGMTIAAEFSDVGPATDRPQFTEMLRRIQDGNPDGVAYVLVFKLSRFGRNTADVVNDLQIMQDQGVNLLCTGEDFDSATTDSKMQMSFLAVLSDLARREHSGANRD